MGQNASDQEQAGQAGGNFRRVRPLGLMPMCGLRPIESLRVAIHPGRAVRKIESVRGGPIAIRAAGAGLLAELPLRDMDMLKLYWEAGEGHSLMRCKCRRSAA